MQAQEGFRDEIQHEEGDGKVISSRESCGIPARGRTGPGPPRHKDNAGAGSAGVAVAVLAAVLCWLSIPGPWFARRQRGKRKLFGRLPPGKPEVAGQAKQRENHDGS